MKNTLTFIFLFCSTLAAFAQNFSAEKLDTTLYSQPSIFTFEGAIDLQNHTLGDLNLHFENIEQNIPADWEISNCLGTNCLPIGVMSGDFTLAVSSPDNYIIGHFYPNNRPGIGHMKIKVHEVFNPSNFIILDYYGVAGSVTGVEALEDKDVEVFPNPVSDLLTVVIPNDNELELKIELIDALGRLVKSTISTQSTTQLDLSSLTPGVYYVAAGSVRKRVIKN